MRWLVGAQSWDRAVTEASEVYKSRMHNLCCDNCHSHVAHSLNLMGYGSSTRWNMVELCLLMALNGRYVSFCGFVKTWLPSLLVYGSVAAWLLLR